MFYGQIGFALANLTEEHSKEKAKEVETYFTNGNVTFEVACKLKEATGTETIKFCSEADTTVKGIKNSTPLQSIGSVDDFIEFMKKVDGYEKIVKKSDSIEEKDDDWKKMMDGINKNKRLPPPYVKFLNGFLKEGSHKGSEFEDYVKNKSGELNGIFNVVEIHAAFKGAADGVFYTYCVYKSGGDGVKSKIIKFKAKDGNIISVSGFTLTAVWILVFSLVYGTILVVIVSIIYCIYRCIRKKPVEKKVVTEV
ncbi:hypothetical protein ECANGB1_175 [Enterospora canceri]|uniref:Uncharacterized protein n=1 Tax=Enterospora canceri TaxID=1081671 RepID=A0A1Y1S4M7_9MICR|nr:hypothetical protein ECANGB1_175 [Enterospora canceri]